MEGEILLSSFINHVLDNRGIVILFPAETRNFYCLRNVQISCTVHV